MDYGESLVEADLSSRLRREAMAWLDDRGGSDVPVRRAELADFFFEGVRMPLADRGRGIRRPAVLTSALSILTQYTPKGQVAPYEDTTGDDGLLRYKYQGDNPQKGENVTLRRAFEERVPLIWFYGIADGVYLPRYPVWIVADEPEKLQFVVAVDRAQVLISNTSAPESEKRRYAERLTRQRLHQPVFRARVLDAYKMACAVCRLHHAKLLDAAHILRDAHPKGIPATSNGLALCKIHHAAYDQNIIGIRPDLVVEVRTDILEEVDGPMLRHGLQEMNGTKLTVPRSVHNRPDESAIEERYAEFKAG